MTFGLVVRFTARDEDAAEAFDTLAAETLEGIKGEPGTLVYVNHSVPEEPTTRVFYELYADRAAFDAHEAQPHGPAGGVLRPRVPPPRARPRPRQSRAPDRGAYRDRTRQGGRRASRRGPR